MDLLSDLPPQDIVPKGSVSQAHAPKALSQNTGYSKNLLPYGGEVYDFGCVYDAKTAQVICDYLLANTPWAHDEYIKTFGTGADIETKHIFTDRKVAWYANTAQTYAYAGSTKEAYAFSPAITKLKAKVELVTGASFNACLLNLYHTGLEGMTWHSDSESEMLHGAPIASLSFGAARKFMLKHKKTKERIDLWLAPGQLIVMQGTTQTHWLHCVPKTKKVLTPRINLTFRALHHG